MHRAVERSEYRCLRLKSCGTHFERALTDTCNRGGDPVAALTANLKSLEQGELLFDETPADRRIARAQENIRFRIAGQSHPRREQGPLCLRGSSPSEQHFRILARREFQNGVGRQQTFLGLS